MADRDSLSEFMQSNKCLIAYATALVQFKPEEISVREYLRLLKQHEAKGRRTETTSYTHKHLDKSSWWHEEAKRWKKTAADSERKNGELKLEIDRLRAKQTNANPAAKRKKIDEDVIPVPRDPKKKSRTDYSTFKGGSALEEAIAEFDFTDVGEAGSTLMCNFYRINATLRSNKRTEPATLAIECIRAAATIPEVVRKAIQDCRSTAVHDLERLQLTTTASSRAVMSLIMGCNRLSHVAQGTEVQGKVIYAYVQMFAHLIDLLSIGPARPTGAISANGSASLTTPRSVKTPGPIKLKVDVALSMIAKLLRSIIENLDPKMDSHKALFEGFAFVLLNKIGHFLYILTFGHPRRETMAAEIAVANRIDEIEDSPDPTPEMSKLEEARVAAPYLVYLMNEMIKLSPGHLGAIVDSSAVKAKAAGPGAAIKGALTNAAKRKLQRTLIICAFGTEGVPEDDPMMNCLKMPAIGDAPLPVPIVEESEVQTWFTEAIWKQIGWDILTKEVKDFLQAGASVAA